MEGNTSMTITSIHGSKVQHVRKLPFGRTFAVTTDDRQWTCHYRDRNKRYGGWVEFHPEKSRPTSSDVDTHHVQPAIQSQTHAQTQVPGLSKSNCELCALTCESGQPEIDGELQLQLVIMFQTEGELKDWGLFVGRESGGGEMLQVKGKQLQMHYSRKPTPNLFADNNYLISRIYTMATSLTPKQAFLVKEIAATTRPPSSSGTKENRGNSQSWCCDVLWELVRLGIANGDGVWQADAVYRARAAGDKGIGPKVKAVVEGEWTWIDGP